MNAANAPIQQPSILYAPFANGGYAAIDLGAARQGGMEALHLRSPER